MMALFELKLMLRLRLRLALHWSVICASLKSIDTKGKIARLFAQHDEWLRHLLLCVCEPVATSTTNFNFKVSSCNLCWPFLTRLSFERNERKNENHNLIFTTSRGEVNWRIKRCNKKVDWQISKWPRQTKERKTIEWERWQKEQLFFLSNLNLAHLNKLTVYSGVVSLSFDVFLVLSPTWVVHFTQFP